MKQISKRYRSELDAAVQEVESDKNLGFVQKTRLTTMIHSEKTGFYIKREFEESSRIFNSIASTLDIELLKAARKNYSRLSFWFFKTEIENNIQLISSAILSNWFASMQETLVDYKEDDNTIEEIYRLNDLLDIQSVLEEKEGFNIIYSIWLEHSDIIEAIQAFFNLITEKKYLKTSFESEIYYQGNWYMKVTTRKHKWRDYVL